MVSLARASLRHESRRYIAAMLALAFSGLLIMIQVGLAFGMFRTFTIMVEGSRADLWVTSANAASFDQSTTIPSRVIGRFWLSPEVADVQELPALGFGEWRGAGGIKSSVFIVPLDTRSQSLSFPKSFTEEMRRALEQPGSVIIDGGDSVKLGASLDDVAEVNQKKVKVIGLSTGYKTISGSYVFCSFQTFRFLTVAATTTDPTYVLIKLKNPDLALEVRDALQPKVEVPAYKVWTTADLVSESQFFYVFEAGTGLTFAFSAVVALLIGIGITSQTLRGAVLASIKEYATLRALGVSVGSLRKVVVEQSFWVGIVGLVVTALASIGITWACKALAIPMYFPVWSIVATAVFIMFVALLSGMFSLGVLYKSQPADLLR